MEAKVEWVKDLRFIGRADSGHGVIMDTDFEGREMIGVPPIESVLIAFGACTGIDVVRILEIGRADIEKFEIKISADRATDYPKVLTKLRVHYFLRGKGLREKAVKRAIDLSLTKYCSVGNILSLSGAEIETSHEIENID